MATKQAATGLLKTVPGLEIRRSRFGNGDAFFRGSLEVAHFHVDHELDLRLGKDLGRTVKLRIGEAVSAHGEWVTIDLLKVEETDLHFALSLLFRGYA